MEIERLVNKDRSGIGNGVCVCVQCGRVCVSDAWATRVR